MNRKKTLSSWVPGFLRDRFVFALAVAGGLSCHSPSLEAVKPDQVVLDDLLQVNAKVCTSAAADAVFPVKVMFIVDTSDSMSVTDRNGTRATAVVSVLQRFQGNP